MNRTGNTESGRQLTTADLAAAARRPGPPQETEERAEPERAERELAERELDAQSGDVRDSDFRERDVRAAERAGREGQRTVTPTPAAGEKLDPLFPPEMARDYRARWAAVQSSFVDDPKKAAKQGDELVAQVMTSLAESFAAERDKLEGQLGQSGEASTEILRVSLRRYRSFFERLLSL